MIGLRTFTFGALATACGVSCLPPLPEPPSVCGEEGQPCCSDGALCVAGLACDVRAGQCTLDERRYCTTDDQCRPGQTCCISGLIGRCFDVEEGATCPMADLEVVMDAATLALSYESHVFAPELSAFDACAIEKGCVGGVGERQLLHFSTAVRNSGDADLLFGSSSEAPYLVAACDGQPYLPHLLDYELLDSVGKTVARGTMQARCQPSASFISGFDCSFDGLRAGWSQGYPARPFQAPFAPASNPPGSSSETFTDPPTEQICQWLDITGVPAGAYVMRVRVNAQQVLAEAPTGNNRVDVPIRLPRFDDPVRPCPLDEREAALLGSGPGRECGWTRVVPPTACTPGITIGANCAACRDDAMLRVCEGAAPCVFGTQRASGFCPAIEFDCPPSGTIAIYSSSPLPVASGASCSLQRVSGNNPP